MSLEQDDGAFLGGEDFLVSKLGISRLTLRQAAKIAEHERMIEVKRGNKGGFYATRPSATDAVRSLTHYLHLEKTNLSHVQRILRLVMIEAAGLAAVNVDPELRNQLKKIAAATSEDKTRENIIRRDIELSQTISAMSGNPLLKIIMAIGNSFGVEGRTALFASNEDRVEMSRLQGSVCTAILSGDMDVARLMMRRRADALDRWIAAAEADKSSPRNIANDDGPRTEEKDIE